METCNTLAVFSLSMTSREIASLANKRHDHVLRDIDKLHEGISPELGNGFKSSTYRDDSGRSYRQFELDRDSSICLVTGYDANARMRIIKRWQELEAAAAKPTTITDPILAALVHGLIEIDGLKQQQVVITRKTEQLESRVEHVELQHRNGVPKGYLSRSQAHVLHGLGLSAEVFHLALHQLEVPTTPYIHHAEDGNDVATFGYLESDIADAIRAFLKDAVQVTRCMCESSLLGGKRFRYSK